MCVMYGWHGRVDAHDLTHDTHTHSLHIVSKSKMATVCTHTHAHAHIHNYRTRIHTIIHCTCRVRPQNAREQIDMCRICTFCTPDQPQIVLGKDKAFTYDYVFDTATEQHNLYDACVEELVSG